MVNEELKERMDKLSLATRLMSGFPLSIGTGLAMESLFNPRTEVYDDERPPAEPINPRAYTEFWVNVETLYRNMVASVDKGPAESTPPAVYVKELAIEMEIIKDLFANEGGGVCTPVFYICSYQKLSRESNVKLRGDKTPGQRAYAQKFAEIVRIIQKEHTGVKLLDSEIAPVVRNTSLVMTHNIWDLLSEPSFFILDLLESNTGKLKKKAQWGSKYYPLSTKTMDHLPFMEKLVKIFGDRNQIVPSDIKLRELVYKISIDRHWTPATTKESVMYHFSLDVREPYVLKWLREL